MQTRTFERLGGAYAAGFLLLATLLPMSNTIALRNVLLLVLALMFCFDLLRRWHRAPLPELPGLALLPRTVQVWLLYLLLFPLLAVQHQDAWQHAYGEWFEIVLAGWVGWGAAVLCGQRGPSLLALAVANSVPAFFNLLLCVAALRGWLSSDFQAKPTLTTVWTSLMHSNPQASYAQLDLPAVLAGFHGVEPMHGNIGYSACQAIVLYCACLSLPARAGAAPRRWLPIGGIALCVLSIFIAQSRGALLFGLLILLVAAVLYRSRAASAAAAATAGSAGPALAAALPRWQLLLRAALVVGAVVVVGAALNVIRHDARWRTMADKVEVGLAVPDPVTTLCEGVSPAQEQWLRARYADRDPADVNDILSGLKNQDGGRILLMRTGVQLVLDNPRGLDGSRRTYQELISARCGHPPVLAFSHAHNAWIDLALGIGWLGAALFALAMLTLLRWGWRGMRRDWQDGWSSALLLLTGFWLLRGFADSVYREHFLQMQWLLLMYLYCRSRLAPR